MKTFLIVDEAGHICDTFLILGRKQVAAFGEYQSKHKALLA